MSPALGEVNGTITGTALSVVLLLPSSPLPLAPQHQTPSSFSAQLRSLPVLIELTPLASPDTATGTELFWPQHHAPPSFTARRCGHRRH
jgi:hypothetical protein